MIDTVATFTMILVLIYLEWRQQRLIKVAEKLRPSKYLIVIIISLGMILLFWSSNWQSNFKVVAVILLMISVSFLKQGLGSDKVVTFGSVGKASLYQRYEEVVVDDMTNGGSSVTFFGHKSGHFTLSFSENKATMEEFLTENLPKNVKLVTEESFHKSQTEVAMKQQELQKQRINAVRNREPLTIKKFLKGKP